jgi:hypothetical protein
MSTIHKTTEEGSASGKEDSKQGLNINNEDDILRNKGEQNMDVL